MTRLPAIAAALFCGPLSGPFAYACVRCAQERRWVLAAMNACAVVGVWVALSLIAERSILAASGWDLGALIKAVGL